MIKLIAAHVIVEHHGEASGQIEFRCLISPYIKGKLSMSESEFPELKNLQDDLAFILKIPKFRKS